MTTTNQTTRIKTGYRRRELSRYKGETWWVSGHEFNTRDYSRPAVTDIVVDNPKLTTTAKRCVPLSLYFFLSLMNSLVLLGSLRQQFQYSFLPSFLLHPPSSLYSSRPQRGKTYTSGLKRRQHGPIDPSWPLTIRQARNTREFYWLANYCRIIYIYI